MKFSLSVKMATTGGSIAVPSFPSSSSFGSDSKCSSSLHMVLSFSRTRAHRALVYDSRDQVVGRIVVSNCNIACLAVQESSASTVAAETKEKKEASPAKEAKAPAKPLPQLMDEDVIPSLKAILEAQNDISELELSFGDNRLDGYFLKKGNPYSFWAFFADGNVTGQKGFSLSSYGSTVSSVEPFLVDEKKVTAKLLVFWVEKRLAAQGIIPVWRD